MTVLAVLESTLQSYCSSKMQYNEATVAVLAVSAVMAVSVMTVRSLNLITQSPSSVILIHPNPENPDELKKTKTSSGGQIFRLQDMKKQRGRRKTKAEEDRQENEEETLKHEKPPPFWWGVCWANFNYKVEMFEILGQTLPTS